VRIKCTCGIYTVMYTFSMVAKLPPENNNLNLSEKEWEALRYIRNELVHRGVSPSARQIMTALGYKSPRSASLFLQKFMNLEILKRNREGKISLLMDPFTKSERKQVVNVPLVGQVAAGTPILAEENIEDMVQVDEGFIKPGNDYYLLRVKGDSMNKVGIDEGDLVLVRQQSSADNGEFIVALIEDEATVKELHVTSGAVVLKPHSTNPENKSIVLTSDFQVQGVVVATIKNHRRRVSALGAYS
jgi:repressor LexA